MKDKCITCHPDDRDLFCCDCPYRKDTEENWHKMRTKREFIKFVRR